MVRSLIIGSIALAMGLASASTSLVSVTRAKAPAVASSWWPGSGLADQNVARAPIDQYLATHKGKWPESFGVQQIALAIRAFHREPTASLGVAISALQIAETGDLDRARRLMQYAQRLNKRNNYANLWLIEDYARDNQLAAILEIYDIILRTRPSALDPTVATFVALTPQDAFVSPMASKLVSNPPWAWKYWWSIVQTPAALENGALLRLQLSSSEIMVPEGYDEALIRALVDNGKLAQAFSLVASLRSELSTGPSRNRVRNGDFEQSAQMPPIEWEVFSEADYGGSIDSMAGLLRISAIGGASGLVARQLLDLDPGEYKFDVVFADKGVVNPDQSLTVELLCHGGGGRGESLARIAKDTRSATLTLNTECRYHWLVVSVNANESDQGLDAAISEISLRRAS